MEEDFDKLFEDIKLDFEKTNVINENKCNILAEQMALNYYVNNEDVDNAIELYKKIVDKYNFKDSDF